MKILYLSPRNSWPPVSGAKLRDYHLARALAKRAELTYIYFGDGAMRLEGARVITVPPPAKYTPSKIVKGMFGSTPLPVLNYTSQQMGNAIEAARTDYDAVHIDSIHLCAYMPLFGDAQVFLDWHNIESELMSRYADASSSMPKRLYARETARRLNQVETRLLHECAGHIVCSEREQSELLRRNPNARVAVIDNGVDTSRFVPVAVDNPTRVLFVGQMSYHANAAAALSFVNTVWPRIRQQFPALKLSIVGSDPMPDVRALACEHIEVTGTVPDVLPYYQGAFASIVPLQTGGGTRLKILEAMAAGAPVISTAIGAEGLRATPGVHYLLADATPESWITALHRVETEREELTTRARDLVVSEYDWNAIGAKLADTYEAWLGK